MRGIYISYRRSDAAAYAARLHDELSARFGNRRVFLDVEMLSAGADFRRVAAEAMASSEVMLVVIGKNWLGGAAASGQRQIDSTDDFVRMEVRNGLAAGMRVIPVLVDQAQMPSPSELPEELAGLALLNAATLSHLRWQQDVDALCDALDGTMSDSLRRQAHWPFLVRLRRAWAVLTGQEDGVAAGAKRLERSPSEPGRPRPAAPPSPADEPANPLPPAVGPRHGIFVSYSSVDLDIVQAVVEAIEAVGPRCWVAFRDLPPGVPSWAEPIVTAIAGSRMLVVLLSRHSMTSIEVLREVTIANDEKLPLFAINLDSTQLAPGLRYFFSAGQRLDVSQHDLHEKVRCIAPAVASRFPALG